jgi:hypothetical protein
MMAEYISRDDLLNVINTNVAEAHNERCCQLLEAILNAPTADVVGVVRCKDCAHYIEMKGFDYNGRKARSCVWHSAWRGENDYCSDAIRTSKRTPKERGAEK